MQLNVSTAINADCQITEYSLVFNVAVRAASAVASKP